MKILNFEDIQSLIDIKIYKFLFMLMKAIFLESKYKVIDKKSVPNILDNYIDKINNYMIKNKKRKISTEYTKENLLNIFKFVRTQNRLYAAEILENILMYIFSLAFKTEKENTLGKYIYSNLSKIKERNNFDLANWFEFTKFNKALKIQSSDNIKEILQNDIIMDNGKKPKLNDKQKDNPLYNFLLKIYLEKYSTLKYKAPKKFLSYINENKIDFGNKGLNKDKGPKLEDQSTMTLYTNIYNNQYYKGDLVKDNRSPIGITKAFLTSLFIYYQNKHSPLINYINPSENGNNLSVIPFTYDLSGATIQPEYTGIVMAPPRIEPRITKLSLTGNILKEKGLLELSKIFLFNKKIKIVDFHTSALKSYQIQSIKNGLGLFDNYIVEELNISSNYLKNECGENLAKILSHLKGLKTINFTSNELKDGISSLLIVLKNLYRQNKINLENLILNKCSLDDISFYELGELLKSKFCKLKNLYLNLNKIPENSPFFKKLKKNKSLTEIYLNECQLGNTNSEKIMRVISSTNIENLSLYKNQINNFDDCLKILYRTKKVLV